MSGVPPGKPKRHPFQWPFEFPECLPGGTAALMLLSAIPLFGKSSLEIHG